MGIVQPPFFSILSLFLHILLLSSDQCSLMDILENSGGNNPYWSLSTEYLSFQDDILPFYCVCEWTDNSRPRFLLPSWFSYASVSFHLSLSTKTINFFSGLDFLGLVIIAIGTGGIKPCVSSFGGDQFNPAHTRMISIFFSLFYFSINAGSTLSMFITPIFRCEYRNEMILPNQYFSNSVSWTGFVLPSRIRNSSYSHADCHWFDLSNQSIINVQYSGLFMIGSFWYKRLPPTENVILRVVNTIRVCMWLRSENDLIYSRKHWSTRERVVRRKNIG